MTYQCIGKRFVNRQLANCTNVSEVPSRLNHPEWGYLCTECSASAPNPRKVFQAQVLDLDKPNTIEPDDLGDSCEDGFTRLEELDRDDFDSILEYDDL